MRLERSYDELLANLDAAELFEKEDLGAIVDRLVKSAPPITQKVASRSNRALI